MPPHEVHLNSACPDCLALPDLAGMDMYLPAGRLGRDTPRLRAPMVRFHPSVAHANLCQFAGSNAGDDLYYHRDQPLARRRWQLFGHLFLLWPLTNCCSRRLRSLLPHTLKLQPGSLVSIRAIPTREYYSVFPPAI